jgi:type IV pilus assembly protein PilP
LPEFKPYSAFAYSASALRSPFESPVAYEESTDQVLDLVDAPDKNRKHFPLEKYALNELTLVGTLSQDGAALKALIKVASGGVYLLEEGQYIGKNNGRVVSVSEARINISEIVPNGSGGWISRPQAMGIKESSGVGE